MAKVIVDDKIFKNVLLYPECPYAKCDRGNKKSYLLFCYHPKNPKPLTQTLCGTHFVGVENILHYKDNDCPFNLHEELYGDN